MVRILTDGDGKYRLVHASGDEVGWIRGRVIGLRGFSTEDAVLRAARIGAGVIGDFLHRSAGHAHLAEPSGALKLVHDGAYEWITEDGRTPLARLCRPIAGRAPSFGIEFVLPTSLAERVVVRAAEQLLFAVDHERTSPPHPRWRGGRGARAKTPPRSPVIPGRWPEDDPPPAA